MNRLSFAGSLLSLGLVLLTCAGFSSARRAPRLPETAVIEIDHPENYTQIYAISDVHGMFQNLIPLLKNVRLINDEQKWIAGKSILVVVGDSIDKGPSSLEVIDFWMALKTQASASGGNVIILLGNHEAEFLADPSNSKAAELLAELKEKKISVKELSESRFPRGAFLRSMPVAARIGKWFFSHAGFVKQKSFASLKEEAQNAFDHGGYGSSFFSDSDSLLEAKKWWEKDSDTRAQMKTWLAQNHLYGAVFGHQPAAFKITGSIGLSKDQHFIKIDNGMAPQSGASTGNVLVFKNPAQMLEDRLPEIDALPNPIVNEL